MPMNFARTAILLALLTGIFIAMGAAIGGTGGMLVAFGVAMVMNVVSLWKSDTIVLKIHGAREVDQSTAPDYYNLVRDLARRAELPMPRVYIMDSLQPNAFATGRSPEHSAVCASTGLLDALSREEVAGVMAHELAHIKNRDTLTMTVAATIGGAVSMLAQYMQFGMLFGGNRGREGGGIGLIGTILAAIVAPLAATLVQMAISRSREYQADRLGAMIAGNPIWLASALQKIQGLAQRIPNETAEAVPATAHMFIINPLTGRGLDNLFSTHPNTENRIAELEVLAREMGVRGGSFYDGGQPSGNAGGPWQRSDRGVGSASAQTSGVPISRPSREENDGPWG